MNLLYVNNKGAGQPAHPHSLISAFVIRFPQNITSKLPISCNILASLCSWVGWIEFYQVVNPEDRFSRVEAHLLPY